VNFFADSSNDDDFSHLFSLDLVPPASVPATDVSDVTPAAVAKTPDASPPRTKHQAPSTKQDTAVITKNKAESGFITNVQCFNSHSSLLQNIPFYIGKVDCKQMYFSAPITCKAVNSFSKKQ